MNELALFAGIGGGILGGKLLECRTICAVEIQPYCREVLLRRQRDGVLPMFPIWDDIRTFDGRKWTGRVDIITGGFPCQDISAAGRGEGLSGERSGLWKEMARVICEVRPRFVFIENSPLLRTRGLSKVLKDLAEMGYDAKWGVLGARNIGAPHKRDRMWVYAYSQLLGWYERSVQSVQSEFEKPRLSNANHVCEDIPNAGEFGFKKVKFSDGTEKKVPMLTGSSWWETEPRLDRVANGIPNRVDRIKALGNAQVPGVARLAYELLKGER